MYFKNRSDAAATLLPRLEKFRGLKVILLAVPEGAVPVAWQLAKNLDFPVDLLMVKKLGHPLNKEFEIGAVCQDEIYTEHPAGISETYIARESERIKEQLQERYNKLMNNKDPLPVKDKIVLVIDEGIASGKTLMAGIKMLRKKSPSKIIVAVPVSSAEAAEKISTVADEFICVFKPEQFESIAQFYDELPLVEDGEILALLEELNKRTLTA
ncbi:MAG TPA: phosphoribosyltransferase family protein [Panacibacter sp.]|nr:phosphoribosyltransferase family protein [Panacibacter sp.]HNP43117.1 phosphoribosyltransferase family protein [Panacibacter sp.]